LRRGDKRYNNRELLTLDLAMDPRLPRWEDKDNSKDYRDNNKDKDNSKDKDSRDKDNSKDKDKDTDSRDKGKDKATIGTLRLALAT